MNSKRAQGLPLNTIIIAIIVVIVLVVIILITTGQLAKWQDQASEAGDFSCTETDGQFCSFEACGELDPEATAGSGECGIGLTCCKR